MDEVKFDRLFELLQADSSAAMLSLRAYLEDVGLQADEALCSLDCSGVNFSGMDVSGVGFYGSDLSKADFSGCNISGCDFSHSNLIDAKFDYAEGAVEVNFDRAKVQGASFFGVDPIPSELQLLLSGHEQRKTFSVLLVEDIPASTKMHRAFLDEISKDPRNPKAEFFDYAKDYKEAVDILNNNKVDFAIIDANIPSEYGVAQPTLIGESLAVKIAEGHLGRQKMADGQVHQPFFAIVTAYDLASGRNQWIHDEHCVGLFDKASPHLFAQKVSRLLSKLYPAPTSQPVITGMHSHS